MRFSITARSSRSAGREKTDIERYLRPPRRRRARAASGGADRFGHRIGERDRRRRAPGSPPRADHGRERTFGKGSVQTPPPARPRRPRSASPPRAISRRPAARCRRAGSSPTWSVPQLERPRLQERVQCFARLTCAATSINEAKADQFKVLEEDTKRPIRASPLPPPIASRSSGIEDLSALLCAQDGRAARRRDADRGGDQAGAQINAVAPPAPALGLSPAQRQRAVAGAAGARRRCSREHGGAQLPRAGSIRAKCATGSAGRIMLALVPALTRLCGAAAAGGAVGSAGGGC